MLRTKSKCYHYVSNLCYKYLTKRRILALLVLFGLTVLCLDCAKRWNWTQLKPPGVVIKKVGGLGNQLFIYACMYSLAKKMGVPIYLEAPSYDIHESQESVFYNSNKRPYVLHKFPIFYDKAVEGWYTSDYPWNFQILTLKDKDVLYHEANPLPKDRLLVINDYCQSELFFKDYIPEIKKMFELQFTPEELSRSRFRNWIDKVNEAGQNSVAIHIRRGDYGKLGREENFWFTPISFYITAIKMMLLKLDTTKNVSFFVFSDQIDLVRKELLSALNVTANIRIHFVSCYSCTTSLEDFYLMKLCKHMITANSTFSWWAAYLNKNNNKTIIAPAFHPQTLTIHSDAEERKFKEYEMTILYPKEWIVLNAFSEIANGKS